MLDLARPLGIHEDLVFYGDHEQPDLVYYLPNEVSLAPVTGEGTQGTDRTYELFLQIFKEGTAVIGDTAALEKLTGAIMSLGVQCTVRPERLAKALEALKNEYQLSDQLMAAPPVWEDGKIDLIVLDSTTQDDNTTGEEAFVESIIGSKKPSLNTGDLKAIFNVRLDREGAALVSASLQGNRSHVAGVLYELKFNALRPALDLRIHADLDRCHDKVAHILSANVGVTYGGVTISVGAELEFIKQKLVEDGDIKVEVLSQVSDPEMQKLIHETVEEFKDKVVQELFRPIINPGDLPDINLGMQMPQISVGYQFKKEKFTHKKVIDIDYRERSISVRLHNPQAHLWLLGAQIKQQWDLYTQTVDFSDLWRENVLRISLLHNFAAENNDLLSAEVLIWRKEAGKTETADSQEFQIPVNTEALASFTFTKNTQEMKTITWTTDAEEAVGYFYQVRFIYAQTVPNLSTPVEILSPVISSQSQDLIIIPEALIPSKRLEVKTGHLNWQAVAGVNLVIRALDEEGTLVDQEIIGLKEDHPVDVWTIRSDLKLTLEGERQYHFSDGRPDLKVPPVTLLDNEWVINDPFAAASAHTLIPVVVGASDQVRELILHVEYQPDGVAFDYKKTFRAQPPGFSLPEIALPVLQSEDTVHWEAMIITQSGQLRNLGSGESRGGPVIIDLNEANFRTLHIQWQGPSPQMEDLDYMRLEFQVARQEDEGEALQALEFSGPEVPAPVTLTFPLQGQLMMKITKRYLNGQKEKGFWQHVQQESLTVRASAI